MAQTRRDFQKLARLRLNDARVLVQNGNLEGAYYLTGLAVECAIKACISKNTSRHDFPPDPKTVRDIYTHDLGKLIGAAGLETALSEETKNNSHFNTCWGVVKGWSIESRYMANVLNARELYKAVVGRGGVMQWLRQRW